MADSETIIYLDPTCSPEERAEDLLKRMSLEEKMAQVAGIFAMPGKREEMRALLLHGIGQISTLEFRTCKSAEEAAAWQRELQEMAMEGSEHHIPAIFHMEGVNGAFIQGSTSFPSGLNRGAAFDPALEERIGQIVARQELAFGITQILAPVLDISRDSRMGRQSESYGEDPVLAAALGAAYTRGLQKIEVDGRRAGGVAKHFLGFHNSQGGIHSANVDMGERLIYEVYAKPFQAAIQESGLKGVMPCYGSVNGLPISASKKYMKELLREEMGFDGVTVSDYGAVENVYTVQRVGENKTDAGERCMTAGMDVELPMPVCFGKELLVRFGTGLADVAILDQAVYRVLREKFRMGLFEHPFSLEGRELVDVFCREEDDQISRQMAAESLILLRNDGVLPLTGKEKTIALIGPHGLDARYYFGGYTHLSMVEAIHAAANSMAGVGEGGHTSQLKMERVPGTNIQVDDAEEFHEILRTLHPACNCLAEALEAMLPEARILTAVGYPKAGSDTSGFCEALAIAEKADVVLLTLGGKNGSGSVATMGEGVDSTDINLPTCQDQFILSCKKLGKPMVGIHFDGRPISSDAADSCLNAILEAFTPAEFTAEAVADVLTGKENPSGKLPLTIARSAGQIPIYYNHPNGSAWHQGASIGFQDYADMPHTPRYFFGHGLSYTEFSYRELEVPPEIGPLGVASIFFTVENTGKRGGTEVAQVYLRDKYASMTRPVMELQGFARVSLAPGEAKRVCFEVAASQMAFLDEEMKWKIEKGEISVLVGSSSADIRLEGEFRITEDDWIRGRERKLYALGTVC